MKEYIPQQSNLLLSKSEGDYSGIAVNTPNYKFNVAKNPTGLPAFAFQIIANLDIDFFEGGSAEYKCQLIYLINDENDKPDLDTLLKIAYEDAPKDLDTLFKEKVVIKLNNEIIWIPYPLERIWKEMSKFL